MSAYFERGTLKIVAPGLLEAAMTG